MAHYTLWRWRPTEDQQSTRPTRLELSTELDIATRSVLTMKNSSGERPTQKIGTMTWAIMVAAAPNSTSGRPTSSPMPTLLTLARCRATTVARAANAEMDLSGRTASATRTAAT